MAQQVDPRELLTLNSVKPSEGPEALQSANPELTQRFRELLRTESFPVTVQAVAERILAVSHLSSQERSGMRLHQYAFIVAGEYPQVANYSVWVMEISEQVFSP